MVQVGQDEAVGEGRVGGRQGDRPALGAADDRAGDLEGGAQARLAGDDELARQLDGGLGLAQQRVQAVDHLAGHAGRAVLLAVAMVGVGRQLGADGEQLALEPQDHLAEPAEVRRQGPVLGLHAKLGPGHAERRDGLVDGAVGLGAQVVLADAVAAEQEAGGAVVAAARRHGAVERERRARHSRSRLTTSGPRRAGPSARPAA